MEGSSPDEWCCWMVGAQTSREKRPRWSKRIEEDGGCRRDLKSKAHGSFSTGEWQD